MVIIWWCFYNVGQIYWYKKNFPINFSDTKDIRLFDDDYLKFVDPIYEYFDVCEEILLNRFSKDEEELEKLKRTREIKDRKNIVVPELFSCGKIEIFNLEEKQLIKFHQIIRHLNLILRNDKKISKY